MKLLFIFIFSGSLFMNFPAAFSQDSVTPGNPCYEQDIMDVVFRRKPDLQDTIERVTTFFVPYLGYTPTNGLLFGVAGNFSFRFGRRNSTNLSAANVSVEMTTEKQLILQAKSNIFAGHNRWFIQGDWRFYLFNIPTFGLGTGNGNAVPPVPGIIPSEYPQWSESFPVKYRWVRIHEVFMRKFAKNVYAGVGYHLDMHFDIQEMSLDVDSGASDVTPHYAYSVLHGFDPSQYTVSGLSLNFAYDSRDHVINAYKGVYIHVNFRDYFEFLGSDRNGSQLWTEFRTFVNVERGMPRHLLAFWLYGAFQTSGVLPYFDLRATGFDQMNSSARGYIQGRWRGEHLVYGEVEYRFPISRCSQVLGGALFFNASTASSRDLGTSLFQTIRPAAGFGLRVMVSRKSRTNILFDFAFGDLSRGLYIQAQEGF